MPEARRDGGAAAARAGTNIALVKYWGKRDRALNLPATGSLSLTLAELGTETRVRFTPEGDSSAARGADLVLLDGRVAAAPFADRVRKFLDLIRERAGLRGVPAIVSTVNTVPTAAGLASSASGFAALALAASRAAGLDLSREELSALARRGSGSAARSIFGGLVEMAPGTRPDGADAHARPLLPAGGWDDLRLVVAMAAGAGEKAVGSTEAMERTAATSPYYPAWLTSTERDLAEAREAVAARDLPRLGAIAERSALRMHACALAADPAVVYWRGATVEAIHAVRALRRERGVAAWFTIDAGPHVKGLCAAADAEAVAIALQAVPGVERTLIAAPGPDAHLIEAHPNP
jgi:diphosphomevalonate decarboxylase